MQLPVERWRHEVGVGLRRPVDDAFTCVAEIDGGFAGYCYVAAPRARRTSAPEAAELVAIYVDPEHWREGAGNALMEAALAQLAGLPYARRVLWTFEGNAPARSPSTSATAGARTAAEKIHPPHR